MNKYKGIETQIKHLQTIEESGQITQYAQGKLNALLEVMNLVNGEDEYGSIVKGI